MSLVVLKEELSGWGRKLSVASRSFPAGSGIPPGFLFASIVIFFFAGALLGSFSGGSAYWGGALVLALVASGFRVKRAWSVPPSIAETAAVKSFDTEAEKAMPYEPSAVEEAAPLEGAPVFEAPASFALPAGEAASGNISTMFSKTDWNTLLRNAQDGGTNSMLASHVLKKTAQILEVGNRQALEMKTQSEQVFSSTQEMLRFVGEINLVSKSARLVAFNLMIEAGRHGSAAGGPLMVVAKEMTNLSEETNGLTVRVEQKINAVAEVASQSQKKCANVSALFSQVEGELNQFKFLMARIEELSISQCQSIKSFEERIYHGSRANN